MTEELQFNYLFVWINIASKSMILCQCNGFREREIYRERGIEREREREREGERK